MKRKGEKERSRRRKGGEEKKGMVALLVLIIATLAEKNCWTQKGLFGDNFINYPARYIYIYIHPFSKRFSYR